MIHSLEPTAPRFLRSAVEGLRAVEGFFQKPDLVPGISIISGGVKVVTGTVAAVAALATAVFYKIRHYVPGLFISKEKRTIWQSKHGDQHSLCMLMESVKLVVLGLLVAIPGIGNASAWYIHTIVTEAFATKTRLQEQITTLTQEAAAKDGHLTTTAKQLEQMQAEEMKLQEQLLALKHENTVKGNWITALEKELSSEKEKEASLTACLAEQQKSSGAALETWESEKKALSEKLEEQGRLLQSATDRARAREIEIEQNTARVIAERAASVTEIAELKSQIAHLEDVNKQQAYHAKAGAQRGHRRKNPSPLPVETSTVS